MTAVFSPDDLRQTFAQDSSLCRHVPAARSAAVALAFWANDDSLRLCVGWRTAFENDPWSGDMAFPGGKAAAEDRTVHQVAAREVFEETGVRLDRRNLLGTLGEMMAPGDPIRSPMPVHPMVYLLDSEPEPFVLSEELTAAYWVPVQHFWNFDNWFTFPHPKTSAIRSAIRLEDHYIWGFTLRVIVALSQRMSVPLTERLATADLAFLNADLLGREQWKQGR